jgi:hypothetical protein
MTQEFQQHDTENNSICRKQQVISPSSSYTLFGQCIITFYYYSYRQIFIDIDEADSDKHYSDVVS